MPVNVELMWIRQRACGLSAARVAALRKEGGVMLRPLSVAVLCASLALAMPTTAAAQAQAANGNIEGIVRDTTGAALPGVTVTVTNMDTGTARTSVTSDEGVYRAVLLPLGRYRIVAELQGFKTFEQQGISLSAGQTALINIQLGVGSVSETVTVTSESPVAEPGKIDLGRTIGENEIKNLPLVSRNPYNFAFLQANVTGYENNEFGVPRINANGTQMRTNYQIDGNTNTEKDRAGLRLLPVSEVLVREVKVITNGFAPEFGQTTGMVYNAITPSGTNSIDGSASFRFRRNDMSSRPFFLAPTALKPDTEVNDVTLTLGGPITKDKWHYYGAYEYVDRSLITGNQVITVAPSAAQTLGIDLPADGVIPAHQKVNFVFGKTDYQLSPSNRLSARYFLFKNFSLSNIAGGLTTPDRATDFTDRMDSASAQLVSTVGGDKLNELRVQYARRHQFRTLSDTAVDGAAITVTGVANFGGPRIGDTNSVGFDFNQGIWQVIDNLTWIRGKHSYKAGIDAQFISDERVRGERFFYTFPTNDAYLAASNGSNPFSYTSLQQDFGDLTAGYDSAFYGFFVQDDWQLNSRMKVLYGLRYDLFDVPSARVFAPNPYSQDFTIDKNNLAPRAGFSWSLDERATTVLRASMGLMYEPPLIDFYDNAILSNGDPRSYTVTVAGTAAGAPAFPTSLANVPPGFRAAASEHHCRRSRLQNAVRLAHQRPGRASASKRHVAGGGLREFDRSKSAGADGRQHDSHGAGAQRRPADLFDNCQRRDARRPGVRSRQRIPVDWRVHVQRVHGDVRQAHDARVAGASDLHVRPRRGQRPAHRHLRRRQQ